MANQERKPRSPLQAARLARGLRLQEVVDGVLKLFEDEHDYHRRLNVQMLCNYERGHRPGWDYAIKLCQFYRATAEQLGLLPDYSQPGQDDPAPPGDSAPGNPHDPMPSVALEDGDTLYIPRDDGLAAPERAGWEELASRNGCGEAPPAEPQLSAWPRREDPVNRLEFLMALLAGGTNALLPRLGPHDEPARLGPPDVAHWRHTLRGLYAMDDQHGGAEAVYELTVRSLRQLHRRLQRASYDSSTGRELGSIARQMIEHAGWLAYDAGCHAEARYWWLEALLSARTAQDDKTSTVVLASMAAQASSTGRPREAVELAQAAQREARGHVTPRLRSLLLAREARGHAGNHDGPAARQALHRAEAELVRDRHGDDPDWLDFYDRADLAWHETGVASSLGDLPGAERASRSALAAVDPTAYPRNHSLYLGDLAKLLIARRMLDEAVPLASQVVTNAALLGSHRITTQAHTLVRSLAPHDQTPFVRDFREWAFQALAR
ncbi:MAG: hypothetical protein ACRD0K_10625 [Egibacteraceae bacterium]